MAKHNEIGKIGEDVAAAFLKDKGMKIVSRNYRKPYGEIDIVARETSGVYRFVEVKTVSHGTVSEDEGYRPEENVHPQKVKRLLRTIESYLISYGIETEWQFDLIAVFLDQKTKEAKVRWLKDIVI